MITIQQAAAARGVSERRLQRLAADGRIPGAQRTPTGWQLPPDFGVTPPPKRARRRLDKL